MAYAILSDVHGNLEALTAVEAWVRRICAARDVTYTYWFLGDVLGYGPNPVECLRWFKTQGRLQYWIAGNHDISVMRREEARRLNLAPTDDDSMRQPAQADSQMEAGAEEGIAPETVAEVESTEVPTPKASTAAASNEARESWAIHHKVLQEQEGLLNWFFDEVQKAERLEDHFRIEHSDEGLTAILVHGSHDSWVDYMYAWWQAVLQKPLEFARERGKPGEVTVLLHGHTHYPLFACLDEESGGVRFLPIEYGKPMPLPPGVYAINPGSVGQPRDGDPRAAFALLDSDAHTITFCRVAYDSLPTVEKLGQGGYPESLVDLTLTANGGANLVDYRRVYSAPDLSQLKTS